MMEVLGVDAFNVSMFGDCFETLLWVRGEGHKLARELATLVSADAILVHEAGGEQLVEVKAGEFVSEETIAQAERGLRDSHGQTAVTGAAGPLAPGHARALHDLRRDAPPRRGPEHAAVETGGGI